LIYTLDCTKGIAFASLSRPNVRSTQILILQIAILTVALGSVGLAAIHFPYPSPLIKPLLPPNLRWPTSQVKEWVESGNADDSFLEFFSRDPDRKIPPGDNIVSASDGVIQEIVRLDDIAHFVVGLSFWDVHIVRAPVSGTVIDIEQVGFSFLRDPDPARVKQAVLLRGKAAPVQQIVTLETSLGEVKVRLVTSYWASRIKLWVQIGQYLNKGDKIGRILLGSTVISEFPGETQFSVRRGQRVTAGETLIAERRIP
jgi:phosphatidylserine decarboxylase